MAFNGQEQAIYDRFLEIDIINPDYAPAFVDFCHNVYDRDYENRKPLLKLSAKVKNEVYATVQKGIGHNDDEELSQRVRDCWEAFKMIIKMEAQHRQFDSYCLYLEINRPNKDRFYQPRRMVLRRHGVPQAFQQLIDDELDILTISMPPGVAKTTCEKFFHSAVIGWFPDDYSLFYSHSGDITRMYYDGVLDIVTNNDDYTWSEIFPDLRISGTNAKLEQFNVGKYKPFPSLQCTSVGAKNAGKVRVSQNGFLFVDDMIGSIEEALNKSYLEKLWNAYSVDARQRKLPGSKEVHIATRWSVLDVIGRIQEAYEGIDRVKSISVPAIDPQTGESNFMYDISPFTTDFFKNIELTMDDISYRCLYLQDPIEREGLLYNEEDLRRYTDLPNKEPDAILGVCDTKEKGIDYMFLPVFYKYDNDYYLEDCICDDNSDFGIQYGRLTDIIMRHKMQQVEFESNQGGSRIAFEVQDRVKKQGGMCNIITHPTETNKETRIIVNSDWIKQNVLFKNKTEYSPKSDYGKMMSFMLGYSVAGKNKHDDVPDGLANFALFISRKLNKHETRIIKSPI